MRGIIFTAKHHCGFCMWPSAYTEYSVKNSPWKNGKGDVVRELADACREEGLKFAVYLSPWDRNHPDYGRPAYVEYFRNQLRELLTNYGDIFEVWFDGANGGDGWYGGANETRKIDRTTYYQWPETYQMIRELQPHCLIWNDGSNRGDLRWVGTEAGNVGETNWSLMNREGATSYHMLHFGVEDGNVWCPGETNTSIRPGWFYHEAENENVKSLSKLMDTYYKSVGRNSTLLLNFPVAPNGRIHPNDSLRGIAFKTMIDEIFKKNVVKEVASPTPLQEGNGVATYYLDFNKPTSINRFLAEEEIALGQRVKAFSIEALVDGQWQQLKDALAENGNGLTTIGHRRIICFPTINATKLRFTITEAKAEPIIKKLGVYLAPPLTTDIPNSGEKKSSSLHIFFSGPRQMLIDWDTEQTFDTFRYLPPQNGNNGTITHYTLWGSTDWSHWTKLASGEFSNIVNNPIWQTIHFAPTKVKVLRFEAERLANGERMGYSDIEVLNTQTTDNIQTGIWNESESVSTATAINLTKATIVYLNNDAKLVKHMAQVLADDIERVSGTRPEVVVKRNVYQLAYLAQRKQCIVLSTKKHSHFSHRELKDSWERYSIGIKYGSLYITGSDARGLAYGVFHVSEAIGVNPWYWFADVAIDKTNKRVFNYSENYVSQSPTIKYRGIFINDEDWGLKTWASKTYEKELGDIGPKTYDRVCELILRLKGNMLAPAMHTCTGAFFSHPESQKVADKWGIMITTSHCEPLLFNNAAPSEWDKQRDGEWNYETNSETILKKLDDRIRETAQYDNIYTMGMRGLHDEAMKGSSDPKDRARTLEKVFDKQRGILTKYKKTKAEKLPQIFVPYKETLDIYDAGLRVPDDITIVWPDDNYGYMKRVSNASEQKRKGGSGVYYHISYLGTPHDNLWIATTAPMLMYYELKKAFDAGANRYWLLNVGDIKPGEIEIQMFMDMAWNFSAFNYENANKYQAEWLARTFLSKRDNMTSRLPELTKHFQFILDNYYRLAWDRKPEFMGYEFEWSGDRLDALHDTDFNFEDGSAQKRLLDYENICETYDMIERNIAPEQRPALFEMLGYAVHSAYQMNRKFLYAQRNHETGSANYAVMALNANEKIEQLRKQYNEQLDGKWREMISEIPPGYCAKYQQMPKLSDQPTDKYRLPDDQRHKDLTNKVDLSALQLKEPFRLIEGIGTDWIGLQLGNPTEAEYSFANRLGKDFNPDDPTLPRIDIPIECDGSQIAVTISVVPFWPNSGKLVNRFGMSLDGEPTTVCVHDCEEWSHPWKLQVLENRRDFTTIFNNPSHKKHHTLTIIMAEPGQIIQKITYGEPNDLNNNK